LPGASLGLLNKDNHDRKGPCYDRPGL